MKTEFKKEFNQEIMSNIYVLITNNNNKYELYRETIYKNNGTCKSEGDWIIQLNGKILTSVTTLKRAKTLCALNEL